MAFRPELLILDEPTAGLDVVARRDFMEEIVELIQEDGRTVFFSSHLVHEVERMADWVGIMDAGKIVYCAPMEELKSKTRRIVCQFDGVPPRSDGIYGLLQAETMGKELVLAVRNYSDETIAAVKALKPRTMTVEDMSLEEIFIALVGGKD